VTDNEFTISTSALRAVVRDGAEFVSPKSTLPVLQLCKLSFNGGMLEVASTNLESGVIAQATGKGDGEWAICLPKPTLTELLANWGSGDITIEHNPRMMVVKLSSGKSAQASIKGIDAQEFPPMKEGFQALSEWEIDAKEFAGIIKRVAPCVSDDKARPVLTGVCLDFANGTLTAKAADGFRAVIDVIDAAFVKGSPAVSGLVLPPASLLKACSGSDSRINVKIGKGRVIFENGGLTVISGIVEGMYPDMEQIIPNGRQANYIIVQADSLAPVLKRARIMATNMMLRLNMMDEGMSVTTSDEELGAFAEDVPVSEMKSALKAAVYNVGFLVQAVDVGGNLTLTMGNETSPLLITTDRLKHWKGVIMPMHLSS